MVRFDNIEFRPCKAVMEGGTGEYENALLIRHMDDLFDNFARILFGVKCPETKQEAMEIVWDAFSVERNEWEIENAIFDEY